MTQTTLLEPSALKAEIGQALTVLRSSLENPSVSLADGAAWSAMFGDWGGHAAGVTVTRDSALGVPAVWAAVNFISSTIAALPLDLYVRDGAGRKVDEADPLAAILQDDVNEET